MSARDSIEHDALAVAATGAVGATNGHAAASGSTMRACAVGSPSVTVGELVGLTDGGCTPLVIFQDQPGTAALAARMAVDLHAGHIGQQVVLAFEAADPYKPIVMGVLRGQRCWPLSERPGQMDVDVDGERLIVSAREQLVLRCGSASITLTKAGKVLIRGTFVSSFSSGVNRVKGGSVQLN